MNLLVILMTASQLVVSQGPPAGAPAPKAAPAAAPDAKAAAPEAGAAAAAPAPEVKATNEADIEALYPEGEYGAVTRFNAAGKNGRLGGIILLKGKHLDGGRLARGHARGLVTGMCSLRPLQNDAYKQAP